MEVNCKICKNLSTGIFNTKVLNKYPVQYYKCNSCGFIQTEEPFWLKEAYESAITQLDIGLVSRNLHFSGIIRGFFDLGILKDKGIYLDYAGGYGMFVRMMRDIGFNFYRQDTYCENIFAKHFDLIDLPQNQKFEVLTAFEVFEHLVDPRSELKKMLEFSDTLVFSTFLQPEGDLTPENWWYFTPQTGQHISLYSKKSLEILGAEFGLNFYTNGTNLHFFTRKPFPQDPFIVAKKSIIHRILRKIKSKIPDQPTKVIRESLTLQDFEFIKSKIQDENPFRS